jgi:outer membrane protein TolC
MKRLQLLISLILMLAPAILPAQTAVAITNVVVIDSAMINALAAEARTNHPALKAADSLVRASVLDAQAVRTWENPMASFGGSVYSSRGFNPSDEGNIAYGIEQKLPLWGRPKFARNVANAGTLVRESELNQRLLQLRSDIARQLYMAALAEQEIAIGEEDLVWLEASARTGDNKYRTGQGSLADSLLIQNEVAKRNDALLTGHRRLAHERFALNRLVNRDANSTWPSLKLPSAGPAIPLSAKLLALAFANEPRLRVLDQQIKQASATADLTRSSRLPEVSFGVDGRQFSGDGEFRSGMFTLRFSLPWANGDKYRKEYARDKERQKSVEQEREDQVLTVQEQLHHLTVDIEAARREALLYSGEITVRAGQALSSRTSDWETGRGALRDALDARRMLVESELMSARATAEQHQMMADMLLWTGLDTLEALAALASEPELFPGHEGHQSKR